jgi:mycofactocin glycosyltransferase
VTVAVVVPVFNASRTLGRCLDALARLDPAPDEIVLVDNGSTDGSLDLLKAFAAGHARARVVEEATPGVSAARNAGLRATRADVVAWTDSDCSPEPDWLGRLIRPLDAPDVAAVGGRVLGAPGPTLVETFLGLYSFQTGAEPHVDARWTPWRGGYAAANFATRRQALVAAGAWDESTLVGEDYDVCARLYAAGHRIAYAPDARVVHHHRDTVGAMLRQSFSWGQGHALLVRKHLRGAWLELPARSVVWQTCPVAAWIDLASADKKLAALLVAAAIAPPLLVLPPLYAAWLVVLAARRLRAADRRISIHAAVGVAALLVAKSAALTAGRWRGALRHRCACL